MPAYVPVGDTVFVPYGQNVEFNLIQGQRIDNVVFNSCHILFNFNTFP